MQKDFHYYATYCAAFIAGFSHEESLAVCYGAQFVDDCSATLLKKINAPLNAASTQLQMELMNARTDLIGRQEITRIWSAFHFLPKDLNAAVKGGRIYRDKYRLICGPNGELVKDTVELAKNKSLQAAGIAMHVLADTWAHRNFAGTPSLVINDTNKRFYEVIEEDGEQKRRRIVFHENVKAGDNCETGRYIRTVYHTDENSVMNLGHGRAGHLPDYSFARYIYLPAWGEYKEEYKDNPTEYYSAFSQMVYALRYLRGDEAEFSLDTYAYDTVAPHEAEIRAILTRRQPDACADWKAFGEKLSGKEVVPFDITAYQKEYTAAAKDQRHETAAGRFFTAAEAQKSMVTDKIFSSGNLLAGFSKRKGSDTK